MVQETKSSVRAWRAALVLALLGHAGFWQMTHHRGASTDAPPTPAMKVRLSHAQPKLPQTPVVIPAAPPVAQTSEPAPPPPAPQVSDAPKPARQPARAPKPMPAASAPAVAQAASAPTMAPEVEKAILALVPESYLPIDELDVTPELLGGWRLNHDAIPKGPSAPRKVTLTVRLWVSNEGHIDAFQVINVVPAVSWYEELLKTIDTSTLRPALKNGSPVGASWEIELELNLDDEL
ncbi:MAG: hypothetical protein RI907_843 [Pseudomonadota bacterium]|jgi:hypothetical protein